MASGLTGCSATAVGQRIAQGQGSAVAALEASLERLADTEPLGALHGVPVSVKDLGRAQRQRRASPEERCGRVLA